MGKDTIYDGGILSVSLTRAGLKVREVNLDLTAHAADAVQQALSGIDGLVAPGEITSRLALAVSVGDCRHAKPVEAPAIAEIPSEAPAIAEA
jgi:hypothetical protein